MIWGKTGRLAHDPHMMTQAPQLGSMLGAKRSKAVLNRSALAFTPSMDANDTLNDCTAVTFANCARAAAVIRRFKISIATSKVVSFYSATSGYDGTPATDNGAQVAKVLAFQSRQGFDAGMQVPLVAAWGTHDPADQNTMRNITDIFGAAYIGVALSVSDQNMTIWDTEASAVAGDPTPGSAGRHAGFIWDWTGISPTDLVRFGTWGGWQRATWRWVLQRCDESHGIAWRQFGSYQGLDYDNLIAEAASFGVKLIA